MNIQNKYFTPLKEEDIKFIMQATLLSRKMVISICETNSNLSKEEIVKLINDGQSRVKILYT